MEKYYILVRDLSNKPKYYLHADETYHSYIYGEPENMNETDAVRVAEKYNSYAQNRHAYIYPAIED